MSGFYEYMHVNFPLPFCSSLTCNETEIRAKGGYVVLN
ncbi:hypothetical protein V6Z12_A08G072800 [Gossypium hirsutum]